MRFEKKFKNIAMNFPKKLYFYPVLNRFTMKKVKLTFTGQIMAIDYCSLEVIKNCTEEARDDNDRFIFCCDEVIFWTLPPKMQLNDKNIDGNGRGKWIDCPKFFDDAFVKHPLPVEMHWQFFKGESLEYMIELADDEEFDISKLQIMTTYCPVSNYSDVYIANSIVYDGKVIHCEGEDIEYEYDVESTKYWRYILK